MYYSSRFVLLFMNLLIETHENREKTMAHRYLKPFKLQRNNEVEMITLLNSTKSSHSKNEVVFLSPGTHQGIKRFVHSQK